MAGPTGKDRRRPRLRLGRPRSSGAPGSTRDSATGLMNAPAFLAVAGHVLGRGSTLGEPSTLVCCLRRGPAAEGERARARRLAAAARQLVEATRGEDVLGRTGPDELSALLPGTDLDGAAAVAGRLASAGFAVGLAAPGQAGGLEAALAAAREQALKLAGPAPILPWEGTDAP